MSSEETAPADAEGFEASEEEREFLSRNEWAICVATFYGDLAERLVGGAVEGFAEGYAAGENYFPEGMERPQWYQPTERGLEGKIREKLERLRAMDREAKKLK